MPKFQKAIFILLLTLPLALSQEEKQCKNGENYCTKCDISTDKCIICKYSFLVPDNNGSCMGQQSCVVGKNYCDICKSDDTLCATCTPGYFPDMNGGCSYTQHCKISIHAECIICEENYILVGKNGFCKSLDSEDFHNCNAIDTQTGYCSECASGYYLTQGDQKCISNTAHCKESIFGICEECVLGFYLDRQDGRKCKEIYSSNLPSHCMETEDGEKCSKCQEGYYTTQDGGFCVRNKNCKSSKDGINCLECEDGYFLSYDRKSCTPEEGCYQGDVDSSVCLSCVEGYYYDKNEYKCKDNTKEGDDLRFCKRFGEECEACEGGYILSRDNKCVNTRDCLKAKDGENICEECLENMYLTKEDNQCTMVENCIKLDSNHVCYECDSGMFYNTRTAQCVLSSSVTDRDGNYIFEYCRKSSYNGASCDACKEGFFLLRPENICNHNNIVLYDKFYMCIESDYTGNYCEHCEVGYFPGLKDHLCTQVEHCAVSEEGDCVECDTSYCLDVKEGICRYNGDIEVEEDKVYYKCLKTDENGEKCVECHEDFSLSDDGFCRNDGDCVKDDEGVCVGCKNVDPQLGFNYCLNKDFACVRNNFNTNCLRCDNDLDFEKCTECIQGYELMEGGYCSKIE